MKRSKGIFETLLTIHMMAIIFLVIIVGSFSCWKNFHESEQNIRQYCRLATRTLSQMAVDPIVDRIAFDRLHSLVKNLDESSRDIVNVLVYDSAGVPVAVSFKEKNPLPLTLKEINKFSQLLPGVISEGSSTLADVDFVTALVSTNTGLGFVRVCMSASRLRLALFWDAIFYLGVALLALAVSSLVYFYRINRNIVLPLHKIADLMEGFRLHRDIEAEEIPKGLLHVTGCDEIDKMRHSFGEMVQEIQGSAKVIVEKEVRIRLLLNSTAEAIYGLDLDGKCTFCNASFLRIIGYENEAQLLGRIIHDIINPAHTDGLSHKVVDCNVLTDVLAGKSVHDTGEFVRADGTTVPVEYWSYPVVKDDDVVGVVVTFIDITDRLKSEIAKREVEERLQAIIDNTTAVVFLKDLQGRFITVNKRFEEIFHCSSEDLAGKTDYDLSSVEMADIYRANDLMVAEQNRAVQMEEPIVQDDGEHIYISTKFPLYDENNALYAIGGIATDITEIKQVEKKLAAEKEQLAVTLLSIGDGVITTDIAGMVVLINQVAEELTGWNQDDAAGRPLSEVFHIINEKNRALCENPVDKVLVSGKIVGLANHTALIAKDGKERSIADSGSPIRDQDNNIIGVVLVFRDVTDQLRTEQELAKVRKLESVGVLAGGIAHDFNNILAAILGNINLALYDKSLSTSTRNILSQAEKASHRATTLTQQLLTFSKGGDPIKRISSLDSIIRDSANFVLRGNNTGCRFEIPEDLWLVEIDTGQISQVIQNIVINAGHAMPEGGMISVSCENIFADDCPTVAALRLGQFVKICINDTGTGMAADVVEQIFDPYFTTKREGSGLGLAITHSIINKHNGHITVASQPGIGTSFTIYLPATRDTEEEGLQVQDADLVSLQYFKVLVMDDDKMVQKVAVAMLRSLGHEVEIAQDGEEAIRLYEKALASKEKFDVVIMDLTIPGGMGGKDAVKQIIDIDPDAKVIVSSGYSNDPIMANCNDYGFCGTLAKPFQLKDLSREINAIK